MKKFYSLFLLMLFAIVGAGQAWAEEYNSGDDLDLSQLEVGDIIHYGVNFIDNGDDYCLYFLESADDTSDDDYIMLGFAFNNNSNRYAEGTTFEVIKKAFVYGYEWDYYLVPVGSGAPSGGNNLALDENSTDVFSADTDVTYDEIRVARTLKADVWNTFCMPFSMTKAQLEANLGSDAEIKRFNGFTVDGENFTLSFIDIDYNSGTYRGAAYMVRTKHDVSEIVVNNVQTDAAESAYPFSYNDYTVKFCRTLHKQVVPEGSYIISNNMFYLVDSEVYIKGFRGYFTVSGPSSSNAKLSFNIDGELVTEIDGVNVEETYSNIYDLQGRHVMNAHEGMYIKNGRKVFIK